MSKLRLNFAQQPPELFKKHVAFSMVMRKSSSLETALKNSVPLR